jgi:hypothetical protein
MIMYYGTNKKPVEIPYARYEYLNGWLRGDYSQFTTAKESDSCRITVALVHEVGRPPLKLVQSKVPFLLLFSLVRKYYGVLCLGFERGRNPRPKL